MLIMEAILHGLFLTPGNLYCCNREQTWIPVGPIPIAGSAPLFSSISKRMLLITWNTHNSPFSRLCLPGLTFKAITLFIHIEIKSCRTENNNFLVGSLQECPHQTFVDSCKNKGLSHPLQAGSSQHQEVCNHQPQHLPF